jgi:hypothetical protein
MVYRRCGGVSAVPIIGALYQRAWGSTHKNSKNWVDRAGAPKPPVDFEDFAVILNATPRRCQAGLLAACADPNFQRLPGVPACPASMKPVPLFPSALPC